MAKGHLQGAVGSLGTLALLRDRSAHLGQRSPPTNWRYSRCDGGCHDSTTLRKNVVRVDRGVYSLRTLQSVPPEESETELPDSRGVIPPIALEAGEENNGFLNAFGMFWRRDEVDWDRPY